MQGILGPEVGRTLRAGGHGGGAGPQAVSGDLRTDSASLRGALSRGALLAPLRVPGAAGLGHARLAESHDPQASGGTDGGRVPGLGL